MENNQELYSNRMSRAHLLSVSLGAILGSSLRILFLLNTIFIELYNVIIINVLGSIIFAVVSQFENLIPKNLRLFLLSGFCASFTTFSATIAQAQIARDNMQIESYFIAIFGNFFMTFIFAIIAIKLTNKLFKNLKKAK